ncbi:hypothetical protein [Cellulomonas sp. URHE0023]|uniref:hypothetical protein n=1 Tax=Cellulomonas sp. URHE0023 TaxID=1380354 RepID=UPI0004805DB3|nr:hypothetical protein [Cellulomonas sp. URHE0023]
MNDTRPPLLVAVCSFVVVEAAAFAGLGLAVAAELVRGRATMPGATAFLALCALGVAALLGLCARGLWRGRRWARSPVMMWQILLVVLAVGWYSAEPSAWALVVIGLSVAIGVGLLLPAVVRATTPAREDHAGS